MKAIDFFTKDIRISYMTDHPLEQSSGHSGGGSPEKIKIVTDANRLIAQLLADGHDRYQGYKELCVARDACKNGEMTPQALSETMTRVGKAIRAVVDRACAASRILVRQYEKGDEVVYTLPISREQRFAVVIGIQRKGGRELQSVNIELLDGMRCSVAPLDLRRREPTDVPSASDLHRECVGAYCRNLLEQAGFKALLRKWSKSSLIEEAARKLAGDIRRDFVDRVREQDIAPLTQRIIAAASEKMSSDGAFRRCILLNDKRSNVRGEVIKLPAGFTNKQADDEAIKVLVLHSLEFLDDVKSEIWREYRQS